MVKKCVRYEMNKKVFFTVLVFALLAGVLTYWSAQNNADSGFGDDNVPALSLKMIASNVENKTVILQDEDTYSITNAAPSPISPLVVAGLGLALVASVPIALKILNYHSKKQLKQNKNNLKGEDSTFQN
jgi:hypothetical protein